MVFTTNTNSIVEPTRLEVVGGGGGGGGGSDGGGGSGGGNTSSALCLVWYREGESARHYFCVD